MADADQIQIVAFGDSITEGTYGGAFPSHIWTAILQSKLRESGMDVHLINSGVPGETAPHGLQRFSYDVLAEKPQVVLIMYGANDSFMPFGDGVPVVSLQQFVNALTDMVAMAKSEGILPVVMTTTPLDLPDDSGYDQNEILGQYMQKVREIAANYNLHVIDHFTSWMEKEMNEKIIEKYLPDGVHPNAGGNRLIAETIFEKLKEIIIK